LEWVKSRPFYPTLHYPHSFCSPLHAVACFLSFLSLYYYYYYYKHSFYPSLTHTHTHTHTHTQQMCYVVPAALKAIQPFSQRAPLSLSLFLFLSLSHTHARTTGHTHIFSFNTDTHALTHIFYVCVFVFLHFHYHSCSFVLSPSVSALCVYFLSQSHLFFFSRCILFQY
jgi:hypothetical protein